MRGIAILTATAALSGSTQANGGDFSPNCYGFPDTAFSADNTAGGVGAAVGATVPNWQLRDVNQEPVELYKLTAAGPVVYQTASYS